jgi:energy-coupling factor transporter ATP-binding protein EcfA2
MTDTALLGLVVDRLDAHPPADAADDLVLAAFQSADAVEDTLRGDQSTASKQPPSTNERGTAPHAAYLTAIEVEGFRGIGPPATLQIDPGPGLTLVVGRNGSGKSSFSEALEMLVLGTNQRWKGRPKVWEEGWQNLHHRHTTIGARFDVDGRRQPLDMRRRWAEGAEVGGSTFLIDGKAGELGALGWTRALIDYPPLLSHHELEGALDAGPSKLYDALAGILGLSELAAAQKVLQEARLERERTAKDARDSAEMLRDLLAQTDDERAATVLASLKKKDWDIDAVERSVDGRAAGDESSALRRLRDLAALTYLDREHLTGAVRDLRAAHEVLQKLHGTDAARAHETTALLQQALEVHSHADGEICPVCGTASVLTYEWRMRTGERIKALHAEATGIEDANAQARAATAAARRLITAPPLALRDSGDVGVDTAPVTRLWERWTEVPSGDDALDLATHLETHGLPLIAAVAELRKVAGAELERRERSWRPAAQAINEWLPLGRAARDGEAAVKRLKAAEHWLRDAHDELRDQRFRPIADAVQKNWTELRQDSNVSLGELRLAGASNQRRLTLDVKVDGESASALGVMSQGELNCLALSLFLPRAAMPESPFRFVVIDDPVQAMDPAKVEGLATMLARAAQQRQVIVLTHDTRLAEVVRFLDIKATVIEVTRRENSVVELRRNLDPVQRYIDDAFAVAKTDGLPVEAQRVIPGFCRLALEAASALAVTRRMLHQGKRYAEVEEELARPTTLMRWLALALLHDGARSGDVTGFLEKQHPWAVDAVRECNRGAHSGKLPGDPMTFIRSVEKLTKVIVGSVQGGDG